MTDDDRQTIARELRDFMEPSGFEVRGSGLIFADRLIALGFRRTARPSAQSKEQTDGEQLVSEEIAHALIEQRDRLRGIALRTRQDQDSATKSVERAEANRDAAIEANRKAWKNLRSANAALNNLGIPSDVRGRAHPTTEDGERFHEVLKEKNGQTDER